MDEWKKSMRNAYSRKSQKDIISEVLTIKEVLDQNVVDDKSRHSWALFNKLLPLELMGLSPDVVRTTGIASSVFRFRDHPFKRIQNLVATILEQWRSNMISDDGVDSKKQHQEEAGHDVSSKKHINLLPSTDDQKQILSNPKKNRPRVRILYKNAPPVHSDKENMIITGDPHQQEVKVTGVIADRVDTERMVEMNSRMTIVPAKFREGEANLKRKPLNVIEEKVEATKRKLYESYKEAEDAKKKRRIQVLEIHELSRQGLLPKAGRQMKPHNKFSEGEANYLKRKPLNMINEKKSSCSISEGSKRKLYESIINSRMTDIPKNGPAKLREEEANLKRNMINEKMLDNKSSCSENNEEKMQATKRKLYESYKEADDAKKKRRIQVLEFHELSKQGLLPKVGGHTKKPRNTLIKKLRSNHHCRTTFCY